MDSVSTSETPCQDIDSSGILIHCNIMRNMLQSKTILCADAHKCRQHPLWLPTGASFTPHHRELSKVKIKFSKELLQGRVNVVLKSRLR